MVDVVAPETRSRMMSGIRGKDTKPEILMRQGLHRMGFRFRLHVKDLPGKPDLVLPKHQAVIFVQGCFWHGHNCHLFKWPTTRKKFWREKIEGNQKRDQGALDALHKNGWRVLYIWECALKGKERLDFEMVLKMAASWIRSSSTFKEIRGDQLIK